MSIGNLYFSTEGRINRKKYILGSLPLIAIAIVAAILDQASGSRVFANYGIFQIATFFINLWPGIALGVKRFHDRNLNGWLFLLAFVPLVNFWVSIEVLFLKGTEGDNKYGSDPIPQPETAEEIA